MAISDGNGLPVAIGIASGERHETQLVRDVLDDRFIADVPVRLIGDKAYDSDPLDQELMEDYGIEMIAPNLRTRARPTQDGRQLRRYRRRWLVERLFAWLLRFRRIVTRWETKAENYLGFVQLGCIVIPLRRL